MAEIEKIVFMREEDNQQVVFERESGSTIAYPLYLVPFDYKEGDIIKAIVHSQDFIEFIELDPDEMAFRRDRIRKKTDKLRARLKNRI